MKTGTLTLRILVLLAIAVLVTACAQAAAAGLGSPAAAATPQGAAGGQQGGRSPGGTPGTPGARGQRGGGSGGTPSGAAGAPGSRGQPGAGAARGNARAVPVEVAKAATGVISQTFAYAGILQSKDSVKITPLVSGRIDSVQASVGDVLKAGDVIAQIENMTFQAQVAQAQAGYDAAQQKLVRMQIGSRPEEIAAAQAAVTAAQVALNAQAVPTNNQRTLAADSMEKAAAAVQQAQSDYDKIASRPNAGMTPQGLALQQATITYQSAVAAYNLAVTPTNGQLAPLQNALAQAQLKLVQTKVPYLPSDIAQFQAAVDQAKAQLDLAKAQLDNTTIRAPFDGMVAEIYISKGTSVGNSGPVALFISPSNTVAMDVEESRISQIKNGLSASVDVSAYPGQEFAGKVTSVAPAADTRTHSFSVVVTAIDDTNLLRPGMFANVTILAQLKPNALLIPAAALVQLQNQSIVYVVKSDNTAEARPVKTGLADQNHVEIVSGLQAGEVVVTAGQSTLVNGASVTVTRSN
jgi:HlyD family secretion protein